MKILNNRMDKLMPEYETSNPDFFQEYFDARAIVDSGTEKKKEAAQWTPYQKQKSFGAIAWAFALVANVMWYLGVQPQAMPRNATGCGQRGNTR